MAGRDTVVALRADEMERVLAGLQRCFNSLAAFEPAGVVRAGEVIAVLGLVTGRDLKWPVTR